MTFSAWTLVNPAAFRVASAQATPRASCGDPESRGPTSSVRLRTQSTAFVPENAFSRNASAVRRTSGERTCESAPRDRLAAANEAVPRIAMTRKRFNQDLRLLNVRILTARKGNDLSF